VKLVEISRTKRGNIRRRKFMGLKQTVRTNNPILVYRVTNEFKKVYQPRTNTVNDKNGDDLVDSRSILHS
jgi:hypothetical protein